MNWNNNSLRANSLSPKKTKNSYSLCSSLHSLREPPSMIFMKTNAIAMDTTSMRYSPFPPFILRHAHCVFIPSCKTLL